MSRIRVDELHKHWMRDSEYRREYEALEKEFSGLIQEQVAHGMNTTQAVIARLEGAGKAAAE